MILNPFLKIWKIDLRDLCKLYSNKRLHSSSHLQSNEKIFEIRLEGLCAFIT